MVELVLNLEVDCPIEKKDLRKVIKLAAKFENKIKGVVELTVVSKKTIKELNKKYRNKNSVTDVLSFSLVEGKFVSGPILGEVYICWDQILTQAKDLKIPPKEEFLRMLIHGLLHLVGYDHIKVPDAKKMFTLQEKILGK